MPELATLLPGHSGEKVTMSACLESLGSEEAGGRQVGEEWEEEKAVCWESQAAIPMDSIQPCRQALNPSLLRRPSGTAEHPGRRL